MPAEVGPLKSTTKINPMSNLGPSATIPGIGNVKEQKLMTGKVVAPPKKSKVRAVTAAYNIGAQYAIKQAATGETLSSIGGAMPLYGPGLAGVTAASTAQGGNRAEQGISSFLGSAGGQVLGGLAGAGGGVALLGIINLLKKGKGAISMRRANRVGPTQQLNEASGGQGILAGAFKADGKTPRRGWHEQSSKVDPYVEPPLTYGDAASVGGILGISGGGYLGTRDAHREARTLRQKIEDRLGA
jgi:hypothetical protein